MKVLEKKFRGSQICKVLSYPISYAIVGLLLDKGKLSLDEITKVVKRDKTTVCHHLTKLRMTNIIRYEKKGKTTTFWIKYPKEVSKFLKSCENLAKRATKKLEKEF